MLGLVNDLENPLSFTSYAWKILSNGINMRVIDQLFITRM